MEAECFSNLTYVNVGGGFALSSSSSGVYLVSDNVHPFLVDNLMFDNRVVNLNFWLNVNCFVLSPRSLEHVNNVNIELLRHPSVLKFGLARRQETAAFRRAITLRLNSNESFNIEGNFA